VRGLFVFARSLVGVRAVLELEASAGRGRGGVPDQASVWRMRQGAGVERVSGEGEGLNPQGSPHAMGCLRSWEWRRAQEGSIKARKTRACGPPREIGAYARSNQWRCPRDGGSLGSHSRPQRTKAVENVFEPSTGPTICQVAVYKKTAYWAVFR
jgi:hypothetical protein